MRELGTIVSNVIPGQVDWDDRIGNGTYSLMVDGSLDIAPGAVVCSAPSDLSAMLDQGDFVLVERLDGFLIGRPRRGWTPTNGHLLIDTGYTEETWGKR